MDLSDLKKTWNALDKQMQQADLVDEKRLSDLIAGYQSHVAKGIHAIARWQKLSVCVGVVAGMLLCAAWFLLPFFTSDTSLIFKLEITMVFLAFTLIFGTWWDYKLFRHGRDTKVDEMPVKEVIERVNILYKWIKYEVIALGVWTGAFFGLVYWVKACYLLPVHVQVLYFLIVIILVTALVYYMYKKKMYGNLGEIKKNLSELEELDSTKK